MHLHGLAAVVLAWQLALRLAASRAARETAQMSVADTP
jgi:hypothetical protein